MIDIQDNFLKIFDHKSKCIQTPLPKQKFGMGSKKLEGNLFAQYYNDIIEHPIRQIRLSFRFGNNKLCVFSIKKFELHGNQFIFTRNVNLSRRENHHLYKNRCYVANKCEIIESTYDE